MKFKSPTQLFSWYYIIIISVILIVGIGATIFTYCGVSSNTKKEILVKVKSIAGALNSDDIQNLNGVGSDVSNSHYIFLKDKLEKIREINKDIRFIYLWGYRDDRIYFMVDSEPITSVDYSPPGQIYEEATKVEKQVFKKELPSAIEFNKDRWGNWLTALVPIENNGEIIAVMGMDMSSDKYFKNIFVYSFIPAISTVFVLLLIIIGFILRKNEIKYLELKGRLISLATHELRSPLTGISWLVETMLSKKEKNEEEDRKNLEDVDIRIKKLLHSVNDLLASEGKDKK